jgi:hypothetical protein
MKGTAAVLWTLHGRVHAGRLELVHGRLELTAREAALSIPLSSIEQFGIAREAVNRLNGLAVLGLTLPDGDVIRIASLQGTGLLHELAGVLAPAVAAASG